MVYGEKINFSTKGFSDIIHITNNVKSILTKSKIKNGIINISVIGSTASISTIEYEPALVEDVKDCLQKLIPDNVKSKHSETWGDDNGFSHMRSTLMGPGITIPFSNSELILGTWQQIILIDHDNRARNRQIYIQIIGE